METVDNIRPLTPTPAPVSREQRRLRRKQREDNASHQPRHRPDDGQEGPDTPPAHVDEYA